MLRSIALVIFCVVPALSAAQSVVRISIWPDGSALPLVGGYRPLLDPNGRFVLFAGQDIWIKDLETGAAGRIATPQTLRADSLSADGRHLILIAGGEDLPPGTPRLHLFDLASRTIVPVQLPPEIAALARVPVAAISADLRWVTYAAPQRLLLHDRVDGTTTLIPGDTARDFNASLSADGRRVLFRRMLSLFEVAPLVAYDRISGTVERVDVGAPNLEGGSAIFGSQLSGGGRFAVFDSVCVNNCGDSVRRIFIRDLDWRRTWELVKKIDGNALDTDAELRGISYDGRFVLFDSANRNLVPNDPALAGLFVVDRVTRRIVRVNGDQPGSDVFGSIRSDGLRVAFGNVPFLGRGPIAPSPTPPVFLSSLDVDSDQMQDDWEGFVGLSPANPADAAQDADFDGVSNLDEFRLGSQPRARFQMRTRDANVDPERARIVLRNRGEAPASVWLRLVDASGLSTGYPVTVAPVSTLVFPVTDIPDRPRQPFLLHVTTDVVIYPSLSQ